MVKREAYLFTDNIILNIAEVNDIIADMIEDWIAYEKGPLVIPPVVKGSFKGYVDINGWPVGTFVAEDDRVFIAKPEVVNEVDSRMVSVV